MCVYFRLGCCLSFSFFSISLFGTASVSVCVCICTRCMCVCVSGAVHACYLPRLAGWRFRAREAVGWTCGRRCNGGAAHPAAGSARRNGGVPKICRSSWFAVPRAALPIRLGKEPPCPFLRVAGSAPKNEQKKTNKTNNTFKYGKQKQTKNVQLVFSIGPPRVVGREGGTVVEDWRPVSLSWMTQNTI